MASADCTDDESYRDVFARLGLVTTCGPHISPLLRQAWKASRVSDLPLLVEGETGTGKQILASAIHELDEKRRRSPFITVPCGAIPESLAESELFGHARGAFSGAHTARPGLFRAARGGTIFLDDVNDLSPAMQAKLLDVLQRARVRPIGSDEEIAVDVRVIAAANQSLSLLAQQKAFRADLYFRLNVICLRIPPLRERMADLSALILAFASRHSTLYTAIEGIDRELLAHLERQPFAGNIRELEHAVQRMLFAKDSGSTLTLDDWSAGSPTAALSNSGPLEFRDAAEHSWQRIDDGRTSLDPVLRDFERALLETALQTPGMPRRVLAAKLGISERSLYQKLHDMGIPPNPDDTGPVEARPVGSVKRMSQTA